jgi:hypothetical protein
MALSDLAAGLATIAVMALYLSGRLEIWHLYVTGAFTGIFQAFSGRPTRRRSRRCCLGYYRAGQRDDPLAEMSSIAARCSRACC